MNFLISEQNDLYEDDVDKLSELKDYKLTAEVLDRVHAGKEKVYTSAELRKSLGLDALVCRECAQTNPQAR